LRANATASRAAEAHIVDDGAVEDVEPANVVNSPAASVREIPIHGARPNLQHRVGVVEDTASGKGSAQAGILVDRAVRDRHHAAVADACAASTVSGCISTDRATEHRAEG